MMTRSMRNYFVTQKATFSDEDLKMSLLQFLQTKKED